MLFRDGGVVGDCVGLTSPRRSCKDGSVVFGVCVVLTQAEKKMKKIDDRHTFAKELVTYGSLLTKKYKQSKTTNKQREQKTAGT